MAAQETTSSAGGASGSKKKSKRGSSKSSKKRSSSRASSKKKGAEAGATAGLSVAIRRELAGLVLVAAALAVLLALVSFEAADLAVGPQAPAQPQNLIGPVGALVADALLSLFGVAAFCFDGLVFLVGVLLLIGRPLDWRWAETLGQLLFVLAGTILAHLALDGYQVLEHLPGGLVGEFTGEVLRGLFGTVGTYLIAGSAALGSMMLVTGVSLGRLVRALLAQLHRGQAYVRHRWEVQREYRRRLRDERRRMRAAAAGVEDQLEAELALARAPIVPEDGYAFQEQDRFEEAVVAKLAERLHSEPPPSPSSPAVAEPKKKKSPRKKAAAEAAKDEDTARAAKAAAADDDGGWELGAPMVTDPEPVIEAAGDTVEEASVTSVEPIEEADDVLAGLDPSAEREADLGSISAAQADFGPRIVESEAQRRAREMKRALLSSGGDDGKGGPLFKPMARGSFELPPLQYLDFREDDDEDRVDAEALRQMAAQIEQTLSDFRVEGQIKDICPGPVITVFEFSPAPGVKISKIANLADDLAMALAALSVRIVAPIPGKGVVGIEVPNEKREIVYMKEIIAQKTFLDAKKMQLPLALGKDVEGNPVIADLARMPHLLVAGATGAGKSVAVNTMITSLLYKHSPDDVRLIMVDPKMLEFSIYADIPHLLLPVVTDPKQATVALGWAVQEMERRYQMLADMGVRNIRGYNDKVDDLTRQAEADRDAGMEESEALRALGIDADGKPEHQRIPYIVVIVDEFADLMMTASKDVETAVARLAQKARAAGIHLILATQRPSTDVVTGLIKANFPTRMALRVTSKTDSRVILDANGAENLLGNGDMLFVPPGTSFLKRVHGAYVSEKEIDKIVAFLKKQGTPIYDESILLGEDDEDEGMPEDMERDEHYEDAVRLVVESRQASISMLQRKLRVGYNRAARMVEMMEYENIVGPSDSCKPRDVLVDTSPY